MNITNGDDLFWQIRTKSKPMRSIITSLTFFSAIILLAQCTNQPTEQAELTESERATYLEQGQQYALQTQSVLGKNLMQAVQTGGTAHALTFCNEQAIPLTDSMSSELGVSLKRVSDQHRNPDNAASEAELAYIQEAKTAIAKGNMPAGDVRLMGEKIVGYYPILTNELCLNCHGDPGTDITTETLQAIKTHYPVDKAIGYRANQLRGIWVVEMSAKDIY